MFSRKIWGWLKSLAQRGKKELPDRGGIKRVRIEETGTVG
jgi:hypothetical protein